MYAAVRFIGLSGVEMDNSNVYSDQLKHLGCRDAGKLRQEGKEYVVADGDVMHFKFNV